MSRPEPTLINPAGLADPTDKGFSHLAIIPPGAKTVYISGQFGADVTGRIVSDDYAGQLRQSFRNLRIAIEAAGAVPQSVAKLTILIVNHCDDKLPPLREELKALFGNHRRLYVGADSPPSRNANIRLLSERSSKLGHC